MSKEWKCTDCVKYKTDACSTCACGYTPTVSCRDVLVDFDYAYHQGRADAIDEVLSNLNMYRDKHIHDAFSLYDINRMINIVEKVKEQKE